MEHAEDRLAGGFDQPNRRVNFHNYEPVSLRDLNIVPGIVNDPPRLYEYAHRLPVHEQFFIQFLDPVARNGLLFRLRQEKLVHPLMMFKEVAQREPYLHGNVELLNWLLSMVRGAMDPRDDALGNATNRCSACGSSFFGFPLADHSVHDCGFVRFIPDLYRLEFLCANNHAFCGCCNARSVHHTRCTPRNCRRCGRPGHQAYHGVCENEYGRSPEAFQRRVRQIRINRGRRIRYLVQEGYLSFPLPTDWVPRAIRHEVENERLPIRGAGPLRGADAVEFGRIPEHVYRWRSYSGLVSVELEPAEVLLPVMMEDEDRRDFMIIEERARETYLASFELNPNPDFLAFAFNIPRPRFPREIHAPLGLQIEVPQPPPRFELAQDIPPVVIEIPEVAEVNLDGREAPIDQVAPNADARDDEFSTPEPELVQVYEDQIARNPFAPDPRLTFLLESDRQSLTLEDRVRGLRNLYEAGPDGAEPVVLGEGQVEVRGRDRDVLFEMELRKLITEACGDSLVSFRGHKFAVEISLEAAHICGMVNIPADVYALSKRVETFQFVMTASQESDPDWWRYSSEATMTRYMRFLYDLAVAIAGNGHPRCFTYLAENPFGPISRGFKKGIPAIRNFEDPEYLGEIHAWMNAGPEGFASFNVPLETFPLYVECHFNLEHEVTLRNEEFFERDLCRVANYHDHDRVTFDGRLIFPTGHVLDVLIMPRYPAHQESLALRIITLQTFLTGDPELHEELMNIEHARLAGYARLWNIILPLIRSLVHADKVSSLRLSNCLKELTHGSKTSCCVLIPTARAFASEEHEWWMAWVHVVLVPSLRSVSSRDCACLALRNPAEAEQQEGNEAANPAEEEPRH